MAPPVLSLEIPIDQYTYLRRLLLDAFAHLHAAESEEKSRIQSQILSHLNERSIIEEKCLLLHALFSASESLLGLSADESASAAALFQDSLFSWGEVFYPKQSCELVALWMISAMNGAERDSRVDMLSRDILNTLDSHGEPIFSLFCQHDRGDLNECRAAYFLFFSAMASQASSREREMYLFLAEQQKKQLDDHSNGSFFIEYAKRVAYDCFQLTDPSGSCEDLRSLLPSNINDHKNKIVAQRDSGRTQYFIGSGCKSGMGFFQVGQCGIVNYGPQLDSIGDPSYFGICGSPTQNRFFRTYLEVSGRSMSLDSHNLISSKGGGRSLSEYEESGFSGLWINSKQRADEKGWSISCHCEGLASPVLYFVFFIKGKNCLINRVQKLRPQSLDRYKGPAAEIECREGSYGFLLQTIQGAKTMEIVPLAGGNSFWGADFLVAYRFHLPLEAPYFSVAHQWKVQPLSN